MKTRTVTYVTVDSAWLYCEIGKRMRKMREEAGLSQEQVGRALGVSRANIANLECGRTAILLPHIYNLARLAKCEIGALLPK
jgi:transcriptional regulator with XRE-family HTH domain